MSRSYVGCRAPPPTPSPSPRSGSRTPAPRNSLRSRFFEASKTQRERLHLREATMAGSTMFAMFAVPMMHHGAPLHRLRRRRRARRRPRRRSDDVLRDLRGPRGAAVHLVSAQVLAASSGLSDSRSKCTCRAVELPPQGGGELLPAPRTPPRQGRVSGDVEEDRVELICLYIYKTLRQRRTEPKEDPLR